MTIKSEMQGTRNDLAEFLRLNRRALGLKRSDVWRADDQQVHTFTAANKVFRSHWLSHQTHIFDFSITPF